MRKMLCKNYFITRCCLSLLILSFIAMSKIVMASGYQPVLSLSDPYGSMQALDKKEYFSIEKNEIVWQAEQGSTHIICTNSPELHDALAADAFDAQLLRIERSGIKGEVYIHQVTKNSAGPVVLSLSGGQPVPCPTADDPDITQAKTFQAISYSRKRERLSSTTFPQTALQSNESSAIPVSVSGANPHSLAPATCCSGNDGQDDEPRPGGFPDLTDVSSNSIIIDIFPPEQLEKHDLNEGDGCLSQHPSQHPSQQLIVRYAMVEVIISYDCNDLKELDGDYQSLLTFFQNRLAEEPEAFKILAYLLTSAQVMESEADFEDTWSPSGLSPFSRQLLSFLKDSQHPLLYLNSGYPVAGVESNTFTLPGTLEYPKGGEQAANLKLTPDGPASSGGTGAGGNRDLNRNPSDESERGAGEGEDQKQPEEQSAVWYLNWLPQTNWFELGEALGVPYPELLMIEANRREDKLWQLLDRAEKQAKLNLNIVVWFLGYISPGLGQRLYKSFLEKIPEGVKRQNMEQTFKDILLKHRLPSGYSFLDQQGRLSQQGIFWVSRSLPHPLLELRKSLEVETNVSGYLAGIHILEKARETTDINAAYIFSLLAPLNPAGVLRLILPLLQSGFNTSAQQELLRVCEAVTENEQNSSAKAVMNKLYEAVQSSVAVPDVTTFYMVDPTHFTHSGAEKNQVTWHSLLTDIESEWFEFGHALGVPLSRLEVINQSVDETLFLTKVIDEAINKNLINIDIVVWYLGYEHKSIANKVIESMSSPEDHARLQNILSNSALPENYQYVDSQGELTPQGVFHLAIQYHQYAEGMLIQLRVVRHPPKHQVADGGHRLLIRGIEHVKKNHISGLSPLNAINMITIVSEPAGAANPAGALKLIPLFIRKDFSADVKSSLIRELGRLQGRSHSNGSLSFILTKLEEYLQ